MPTWPVTLPPAPAPGAARQSQDARLRTPTDAGPAIVRRRYTAVPSVLSWTIPVLSGTQAQALEAFYETDLEEGALRFDMVDPLTKTVREMRFLTPPRGTCFEPNPDASLRRWRYELDLEILP